MKEALSFRWLSEVYCTLQYVLVAQVRRTVPARQDKGDRHRSKHFRDGRDTFTGEIHIKYRGVWTHVAEQLKRHPDSIGWTHHLITGAPKHVLKFHGDEQLILYDQDLARLTHSGAFGNPFP
jgi:hypothetical protein